MRVPNTTVEALLAQYRIHTPITDERYLHHADVSVGVPLHIVCVDDPLFGKRLVVSSNRRRWTLGCPLSPDHAAGLVRELRESGVLPKDRQTLEMVEHLLLRCSALFTEHALQRLRLAPVYVRRNDYQVGGAAMNSSARISAVKRLEPHAHDVGAVFAHRPTVRQKYDPSTKRQT